MKAFSLILTLIVCFWEAALGVQNRSRSEGLPGVHSSNTVGLGNIWISVGLQSFFHVYTVNRSDLAAMVDSAFREDFFAIAGQGKGLKRSMDLIPALEAIIGLSGNLHLELRTSPWDGEKIGASAAQLKYTTPRNDNLRILGFAAGMGAVLSTEENASVRLESTPGFDPIPFGSLISDLDLIKINPAWPLKLYLNYSNLDEFRLASSYSQHKVLAALEYKGPSHSLFLQFGSFWYKPLATKLNPEPDGKYLPPFYELTLGARIGLRRSHSLSMGLSLDPTDPLSFYSNETKKPPRFRLEFEFPILNRETRAEAIRALIYYERIRQQLRTAVRKNPKGKSPADSAGKAFPLSGLDIQSIAETGARAKSDTTDIFKDIFAEEDVENRDSRKRIRMELKQIEELLE